MGKATDGQNRKLASWKHLLGAAWRLAKPYWLNSEEKGIAWGMLAVVVSLALASVYLLVQFNTWNQQFYDAVQKLDLDAFWKLIRKFCGLAAAYILVRIFLSYFTNVLETRWRRWMTHRYIGNWLDDKSHYLWQLAETTTDNPDQRIAEDIREYVERTLDLSVGLLDKAVTLVSFVTILWTLSGTLNVPLGGGRSVAVAGYMAWLCLLYAFFGTWISHAIGRPLIGLNYRQQRYEADFRFGLARLRENGESVALSDGEAVEKKELGSLFVDVYLNARAIIRKTLHLDIFRVGYDQAAVVFPYLLAAPRYFAKQITLGTLFQVADAFGQVNDALSWAVANYDGLAFWRSVIERLEDFDAEIERTKAMRRAALAVLGPSPAEGKVLLDALSLSLPGREEPLTQAATLEFAAGRSVLVSGPSGSGKSTLLRALGGIWPFTRGRILLPAGEKVLVLPQKPYLPLGSLRTVVSYPSAAGDIPDATLVEVLELCHLAHLKGCLDEVAHWSLILSVGEQQRLAWARVFLQAPRWLFLDEATSALDEETQSAIYRALAERLPATTMISVAHTQQPRAHHQAVWRFGTNDLRPMD
jgi:putative ATP-binding cassette transporter